VPKRDENKKEGKMAKERGRKGGEPSEENAKSRVRHKKKEENEVERWRRLSQTDTM